MYIHTYIYIYIYQCALPVITSPQWLCSNPCTWAHDVQLHVRFMCTVHDVRFMMYGSCAQVHECMSCLKVIVVITGRAHCFYYYMYPRGHKFYKIFDKNTVKLSYSSTKNITSLPQHTIGPSLILMIKFMVATVG